MPERSTAVFRLNLLLPVAAFFLLLACSHQSVIRTAVGFSTKPPDLTTITVRLKNQEMRPTAELLIDVSVQLRRGENWGKAASVLHPDPAVLNRLEERILRSTVKLSGEGIRAKVTVKERASGRILVSEEFEETLPSGST